ncbi:MAG TPA: non-homologous end-joining DNA ligase [Candidatus Binatia bacterium]|nr:non-homologous end-joining DNA ligase [Candidatus Binatia bacterium]
MASHTTNIDGKSLVLTNLDKVMYPESGFTKGQAIDYYKNIAPYILPYVKDRPITLKRYPNGIAGKHFYEKDAPSHTPAWVKTFQIPRTSENSVIDYILINDVATLVWSANLANLEIHPFLAKAPHIDQPTMVVFDLDPGTGANILKSCEVAFLLKDLLDRLKLESFVKVSGSKGIHVHVPLNSAVTYEATQPFAKSVAQLLEKEHPDLVVSEMPKVKRTGKVFVDWSQNSEHKSTVAVYSLRAQAALPFVAMPVRWDELREAVNKNNHRGLFFAPDAALKRLKKLGDIFAPVRKLKQKLPQPFLDLMTSRAAAKGQRSADALETYRQKRDFTKTAEPPPSVPGSENRRSSKLFVIQKHAASHLHYDLRLEMNGTLKSWAVPKGPPYDLDERRLAMAVEDHPMDYARFEGVIPKGEYGGGTVMVWDIGSYEVIDGSYWQGKLHVNFHGKKLAGEWILVKGKERDGKDNVWYLLKTGVPMKRLSAKLDDSSAVSRRSMAQIADAGDAVWHSNRSRRRENSAAEKNPAVDLDALPKARSKFIEPMEVSPVRELPNDGLWFYEAKFDGYRCLAAKSTAGVALWSRRGNVFTTRYRDIARACEKLPTDTLIDGELIAVDDAGRLSFNALQNNRPNAHIQLYAFDILVYRGRSVLGLPLETRQELLVEALAKVDYPVLRSAQIDAQPADLIRAAKELELEGIVAKRKGSIYEPGRRSGAWIKFKIHRAQEFVIGGYTAGNPFDSLIVGYYDGADLKFVAKVRNGFVPNVRRTVYKRLTGIKTEKCPFTNLPEKRRSQWAITSAEMENCHWLKPELVAQVEFAEWTPDGHLRHSSFVGLREDKDPRQIVREVF